MQVSDTKVLKLPDEAATIALGERLAGLLLPGDIVALEGDLGAGKTTLARGLITALAGNPKEGVDVPSPTFTLVQAYEMPELTIWHFDLYRLESPNEIWELGFEEALQDGVSLIEWPERAGDLLPEDRLTVTLAYEGEARRAELSAGASWQGRIANV
jgi:tRNA threonylcarbamoyladenosine biosynthesis protein TsaE